MLVRARLRLRADWAVPANKVTMAACPITATVMWLAGRGGIVARQPLWLLSVAVAASFLLSTVTSARYDGRPTRGRLHERIAAQVLGTTFVMFLTGWGPLLVVGYPIISHELIAITGGRSWRAVLGWSLVGLCAGDAAIALGIAPTLIPEPAVYGLALLGGLGTLFVISTLGLSALRTEQAERSLRESELRLQRTIDTAIEAYVEIDGMGVVTAWNAQAELTLGWTADEAIGRPIDELVIPE
jgi:PAS domain-containing protein